MIKVLFVCLGNICRSPLAQGIFEYLTEHETDLFFADSAGTSTYHIGELPDDRAIAVAQKNHIILAHRARQIQKEDFERFDYIIAMDKSNYQNILSLKARVSNASEPNIMLMRSFDTAKDQLEVPDPFYGSQQDFERCYEILYRCMDKMVEFLRTEHKFTNTSIQ
jgi:protein-tyrosine phosphatase